MYICPVCGNDTLEEPAYDLVYDLGSFNICDCCGYMFGGDDDYLEDENGELVEMRETAHRLYRQEWIAKGAEVFMSEYFPEKLQQDGKVRIDRLAYQLSNLNI